MAAREEAAGLGAARILDGDEVQGGLTSGFFPALARAGARPGVRELDAGFGIPLTQTSTQTVRPSDKAEKPSHYKVICISMYTKDLERLDDMVDTLKANGLTKANRSALIRAALEQVDLAKVPRGI